LNGRIGRQQLVDGWTGAEHAAEVDEQLLVPVSDVVDGVERAPVRRAERDERPAVAPVPTAVEDLEVIAGHEPTHAVGDQNHTSIGPALGAPGSEAWLEEVSEMTCGVAVAQAPVVGEPLESAAAGQVEFVHDGLRHIGVTVDLAEAEHAVQAADYLGG